MSRHLKASAVKRGSQVTRATPTAAETARFKARNPLLFSPGEVISREHVGYEGMIDIVLWRCQSEMGVVRVLRNQRAPLVLSWEDGGTGDFSGQGLETRIAHEIRRFE